jgi:tetraacyldisaccharide 4'-kinase
LKCVRPVNNTRGKCALNTAVCRKIILPRLVIVYTCKVKLLSLLLLPFTLLYALGIALRNGLYRYGLFKRSRYDFPVVCVGNLRAGGTGKTPHIHWLIEHLKHEQTLALLSRGYGRTTQGYLAADSSADAKTIGDEPAQLMYAFSDVPVAVSENRVFAIPSILTDFPDTTCILMDDGYQHLALQAGLYILLTEYAKPFTRDWMLPSGRLREFRSGYKRADVLIVSKCPPDITTTQMQQMRDELKPLAHQQLYFTTFHYETMITLGGQPLSLPDESVVLAISSIAQPSYFIDELKKRYTVEHHFNYADHYAFTDKDVRIWKDWIQSLQGKTATLVCTEKDAVKIRQLCGNDPQFAVLPVRVKFITDEIAFLNRVKEYIASEQAAME